MTNPSEPSSTATWRQLLELLGADGLEPLADHLLVQRSADVTLLGIADCAVRDAAGIAPSRYAHTGGVVRKVREFADASGLESNDRRHAIAAGLVHDLCHFPLSHSVETAIDRAVGRNHHSALASLLRGEETKWPELELRRPLVECGIDADRLASILGLGSTSDPLTPLFLGTINVDTLDAIARAARFAGLPVPESCERMHTELIRWSAGSQLLEIELSGDGEAAVGEFLALKQSVYETVVYAEETLRLESAVAIGLETRCREQPDVDWQDLLLWGDVEFVRWLAPGSNGDRICATLTRLASQVGDQPKRTPREFKRFATEPVAPVPARMPLADLRALFPRTTEVRS